MSFDKVFEDDCKKAIKKLKKYGVECSGCGKILQGDTKEEVKMKIRQEGWVLYNDGKAYCFKCYDKKLGNLW